MEIYKKEQFKNAKIYTRILPSPNKNWVYIKLLEDEKTIYCRSLQDFSKGYEARTPKFWSFKTDGVFCTNNQSEIYNFIIPEVLEKVTEGNNAIVFAYGQSGAGKSLTSMGLAPLVINDLFQHEKEVSKDITMEILMSFIETNGSQFADLLRSKYVLLGENNLKNIRIIKLRNEQHGVSILKRANSRRSCTEQTSYTSHKADAVVTFYILKHQVGLLKSKKSMSKLHIVDLAGADTCRNLPSFYKGILDVINGNLTKSQLEHFLLILCENIPEKILVKQRLNVLIKYLADSLNMHCVLRFINHIKIEKDNLAITLSLLRFGQIIRSLRSKSLLTNETEESNEEQLQNQLSMYQKQKQMDTIFRNKTKFSYLTKDIMQLMRQSINDYINNKTSAISVLNVSDTNTIFNICKSICGQLQAEKLNSEKVMYEKGYADGLASLELRSVKSESSASIRQVTSVDSNKSLPKAVRKYSSRSSKKRASVEQQKKKKVKPHEHKSAKDVQIPQEIPPYEVAWGLYTTSNNFNYEELSANTVHSEKLATETFEEYMKQVLDLRNLNEASARLEELIKLSDEKYYERKLRDNQRNIEEKEEDLSQCTTQLKTVLSSYNNAKKLVKEDFDKFCILEFGSVVPELLYPCDEPPELKS